MTDYLLKQIRQLPTEEKVVLLRRLQQSLSNADGCFLLPPVEERAAEYADVMKAVAGVDVYSHERTYPIPVCRAMIIRQLVTDGFSISKAAGVFKLSHCTYIYHRNTIDYAIENPKYFKEIATIWARFQQNRQKHETN